MGIIVITAFRPKPGQESDLMKVIKDHMPMLRGQGLITDRKPIVMRSAEGWILEVFEWKSEQAVDEAHRNPMVGELWTRFEACSEYKSLRDVKETTSPFPHFEPVEV